MQAGRPAQPSAADSPSSSHPRKGFCEASICEQLPSLHGRQGRPGRGPGQAHRHEPRGSAPRERDHRGGDHPVPSRTRQLSPPSPRVLQRQAAGGQGVALAEGAFLMRAARGPRGEVPPAGLSAPCGGRGFAGGAARNGGALSRRGPGRGSRAGPEGALRAVPLAGPISVLGR